MKIYLTDHHPLPLPEGHRFPASKYRMLRERIEEQRDSRHTLMRAPAATDDELLLAHSEEYLRRVGDGELNRAEILRLGLPWSRELVVRSRHSTGATLAAARTALAEGISVNLAGGTHHAFRDQPEGFCVFNDTVVAARVLQREGLLRQVAVVDTDVHQGNGTASITAGDPTIFTFSLHGAKNFPFQKVASDLDLALPDRTGDAHYLAALERGLARTFRLAEPDLVFFLAGADPFAGDRFSRWSVSKAGLGRRDEIVFEACERHGLPVVVTMAGGYARTIEDTVDIHENTVRHARDSWNRRRTLGNDDEGLPHPARRTKMC